MVIHSYRVRFGLVEGDPAVQATEMQLRRQPRIGVPTVVLHGGGDGVFRPETSAAHHRFFTGPYARRVIDGVGHNLPQEAPAAFAQAVLDVARGTLPADPTEG